MPDYIQRKDKEGNLKLRAQINEIENIQSIEKINKPMIWSLERLIKLIIS